MASRVTGSAVTGSLLLAALVCSSAASAQTEDGGASAPASEPADPHGVPAPTNDPSAEPAPSAGSEPGGGASGFPKALTPQQSLPENLQGWLRERNRRHPALMARPPLAAAPSASAEVEPPAAREAAVEGYTNGTCAAWERSFVPVYTATNARGCALNDAGKIYNPETNPKGARCTVQDMRVNIYGRNPATGFARKPQDNVGLQYGLAALNTRAITVDEFLDLNEKIGGNDIDGNRFIAPGQRIAGPARLPSTWTELPGSGRGKLQVTL